MAIYATAETNYELPAAGLYPAVCVDVVDEGYKPTQFGDKHKVRFVFQIDEQTSKGYRHTVSSWFNLSMHENSSLRKFLEAWRGRPFTDQEINQPPGFDLESVIGKPCTLNIVHNESNGKTYANVGSIAQHSSKFGQPIQPENYIRVEDREGANAHGGAGAALVAGKGAFKQPEPDLSDDDIPF
jgi:hypothetical protein